ncbi:hypothetical protein, partial [Actinomyces viscosus]
MCQHTPNTTEYQRKTHLKTQTPPKRHESGLMAGQRFTHGRYYLITVNLLTQCFNYEMGVLLFISTGMLAVSIAKVEFPNSQAFGNADLTVRCKADASDAQQTGAIGGTQAQVACQAVTTASVVAAQERLCLPGSACLSPSSRWAGAGPQIVLTATTVRLPTLRSQDFDTDRAVTIALRSEWRGCVSSPEVAAIQCLRCCLKLANRVYSPGWQPDVYAALDGSLLHASCASTPSCNLGTT